MEVGLIFALLAAACFAGSHVFIRRGVHQAGESFSAVPISLFIGAFFFAVSLLFTWGWSRFWSLSWQGFVLLAAGGIIHFVAGRLLSYSCIRLIGANKAGAILRTVPFYAIVFSIIFLNESLTTFIILGVLCIVGGATLVTIKKKRRFLRCRVEVFSLG